MTAAKQQLIHVSAAYAETVQQQQAAADPASSVWLAASAGTGKTKVLVDRLLRLLLQGNAPESILCLTYTKAAAAEMANRLIDVLMTWAAAPREVLFNALHDIGHEQPTESAIDDARKLFARVLDCPGGMRIQTLHSFCQELLQRFPLESGIAPHFTVLDDASASSMQRQVISTLVQQVVTGANAELVKAFGVLQPYIAENKLRELLAEQHDAWQTADKKTIAMLLGVKEDASEAAAYQNAVQGAAKDYDGLLHAADTYIQHATDSKKEFGYTIAAFLKADMPARLLQWDKYASVFLTEGRIKADTYLLPQSLQKQNPQLAACMRAEAAYIIEAEEAINAARVFELTCAFGTVAAAFSGLYKALKQRNAVVDYADLVQGARGLLTHATQAAWVRYKLDYQLNHLLLDEAQDTSPEQWVILKALTDEFVSAADGKQRTLFVVGDEKQSIYSFNGADARKFAAERLRYENNYHNNQQPFRTLPLTLSFRSAQTVLDVVNAAFAESGLQQQAARVGAAGVVALWPLIRKHEEAEGEGWALPLQPESSMAPNLQLANSIAVTIKSWLDSKTCLPDRSVPIDAGDVMILVQRRSGLMDTLVKALKQQQVPVAGVDKLVLAQQIAVTDLLALMQFVLLPTDDLTLAALLKTPLCAVTEDDLFTLCHGRAGALWPEVKQKQPAIAAYLDELINLRTLRPYDFIQHVLQRPCPGSAASGLQAFQARLGEEVTDPLAELMQAALQFEEANVPSLQLFLHSFNLADLHKKRELSEAAGKVRVMTVHASKGLQAPVVFLADANRPPLNRGQQVLADPDDDSAVRLFLPGADFHTAETKRRSDEYKRLRAAEYKRLQYVAMTRAEDMLIVCGIENGKSEEKNSDSWYKNIQAALDALGAKHDESGKIIYSSGQKTHSLPKKVRTVDMGDVAALPSWAMQPIAAHAAVTMRPLSPGALLTEAEDISQSPLAGRDKHDKRFIAGIITHSLLEVLPGKPALEQQEIMHSVLAAYAGEVPQARLDTIKAEVMAVLSDPVYAPLFGPGSMAEVPVVGVVDGHTVCGKIDRLLVTDTEILIVDYKTNRPPPQHVEDVTPAYIRQLQLYAKLLQGVYGKRIIKTALLWTDGPVFMPVPNAMLNGAISGAILGQK